MIGRVCAEEFDRAYGLLEVSFPLDEYRPYAAQKALLQQPRYELWQMEESGELKALAAVWDIGEWLFVEHLAVDPRWRNRGIGSLFLRELAAACGKPLCLEVELPENDLARRRIGFYQRNGFVFNDYPYEMPALAPGQRPVPLRIMTAGHAISEEEFVGLRALLYEQVYGKTMTE